MLIGWHLVVDSHNQFGTPNTSTITPFGICLPEQALAGVFMECLDGIPRAGCQRGSLHWPMAKPLVNSLMGTVIVGYASSDIDAGGA
jgi:hypothetical protein